MATSWLKVTAFLSCLFALSTSAASGQIEWRGDPGTTIQGMIRAIQVEPSGRIRAEMAKQLSDVVRRSDAAELHATAIDDIAGLLRDSDDWVRVWAANCLGHIGSPASRTVPALREALDEALSAPGYLGYFGPDFNSASPILAALERITRTPWVEIWEAARLEMTWVR